MEIIKILAFVSIGTVSLTLFILGVKLLRSDTAMYHSNRSYNKSVVAALKGVIYRSREGSRDFRCAAGMAFDKKSRKIVFQGKLSNEAIQDVIR